MDLPVIRVIGFREEYIKTPGTEGVKTREWVSYAPVHNINATTSELVHTLIPPEHLKNDDEGTKMGYMQAVWRQIEPAYKAWKSNTEIPVDGTPLGAWSGVNAAQADVLRQNGIRTVEEVAAMTESQINKIMLPQPRMMKLQAVEYLESRKGDAVASRIAAAEEKSAALEALVAELMEARKVEPVAEEKPRRGRPPKHEVEEAA